VNGYAIGAEGARSLSSLSGLTSLDLGHNGIGDEGARSLSSLSGLTSLNLGYNRVGAEGARSLSSLSGLTSLNLGYNSIGAEGAHSLSSLSRLTSLDLSGNGIGAEGACSLSSLSGLTSLDLRNNEIGAEGARAVLEGWLRETAGGRRERLNLRGNGDLSSLLPGEALDTDDAQAILAAYRAFRDAGKAKKLRPLNEAKLLVVGEEAVGKTSLIRYLVEGVARDPDEAKTAGAQIQEKIETQTWAPAGSEVTLNIWDFGGQEIMHGTHRFFLTKRSLYLVVLEARREDDRSVYRWLKMIRNRGGGLAGNCGDQ
jgi:internalin A